MKKYDNNSKHYRDWSSKYLKETALSLHDCIYGVNSCYGTKDMIMLEGCLRELENRGFNIEEKSVLHIGKWRT